MTNTEYDSRTIVKRIVIIPPKLVEKVFLPPDE
jgi:hypothetical protein